MSFQYKVQGGREPRRHASIIFVLFSSRNAYAVPAYYVPEG